MNLFKDTDHPDPLRTALAQVDHATALVQLAAVRGLARDGDAADLCLQLVTMCQQALENVATATRHRCQVTYPELREMLDALSKTKGDLERMRGAPT